MLKSNPSLIVYDPDFANPYGREVAILLAEYRHVRYAGANWSGWMPRQIEKLAVHKFAKDGHTRLVMIASYVWVLIRVTLRILRGDILVVIWCRTSIDRYIFGLLTLLGARVLYVVHNPRPRRAESRVFAHAESFLRSKSDIVVHSEKLLSLLGDHGLAERASIVPHPPYKAYSAHYADGQSIAKTGKRILFLGQLRPDKSPADMAAFLAAYPRGGDEEVVFCGRGELTPELRTAAVGLSLIDKMDVKGVSDEVLCSEVAAADVLVAPYREVTQSGSIILALSFGVPVVSYRSGAVIEVVDPKCLAVVGDVMQLSRLVSDVLEGRLIAEFADIDKWRAQTLEAWISVLECR